MVEAARRLTRLFPEVLLPKGFSLVLASSICLGILQRQARRAPRVLGEPSLARIPPGIARALPQ